VPIKEEQCYLEVSQIWLLVAGGSYTTLHCTDGQTHVVSKNLGAHEELLPHCFARPNQSHIINLHYLRATCSGNVLRMAFPSDVTIVLKRDYREAFESRHNLWLLGNNG
jgi:DNA-binding LytR/AlgR family response regulator